MSSERMRVLHLPATTPYVRKLRGDHFDIVNGTRLLSGARVPDDVSASWVLDHAPLDWFDVLHLHHLEFEDLADLERLLDACIRAGIGLTHTVHDLRAMFTTDAELHKRLNLLDEVDVAWVCLTPGSVAGLERTVGHPVEARVIPHGYVVAPNEVDKMRRKPSTTARYLIYGATRPNRDQVATVINWSLYSTDRDSDLHLMMRGISPAHLAVEASPAYRLAAVVRSDPRIRATMRGYPTDRDIHSAAADADALILPYLWTTHSGQLELAFDLGLLPVASGAGYLADQHKTHAGLVDEPVWFDWSTGNPYTFGERFVEALAEADRRLREQPRRVSPEFADYRRAEHADLLAAYADVYKEA